MNRLALALPTVLLWVADAQYDNSQGSTSQCWDGQPHVGKCYYGGWCPPRYQCFGDVCCSMEGRYPYCPEGGYATRKDCHPQTNPCGIDEHCLQYQQTESFCCHNFPNSQPKCPDGWPTRGSCSNGERCVSGTVCYQRRICCPEYGISCPTANSEFHACGTGCETSCDSIGRNDCLQLLTTHCVPGCYCKQGYTRQTNLPNSNCVPVARCSLRT